ncbi:MAG TPA: hypothetical protein VHZ27_05995 [Solirubrobacteraceae bacterium]|nr:hypothetical protein [Solirubrobacteraceae bacterium]
MLVATLAAFGLWYVELRPSSSSSGGASQGAGTYQSAINQAHQAVKTSNAANARLGAPTSTGRAPASPTSKAATAKVTASTRNTTVAKSSATAAPKPAVKPAVKHAVKHAASRPAHKAVSTPAHKAVSTAEQLSLVTNAITAHKVVAVLFYNDAAADDQAVHRELAAVPNHGGQVVKAAVPLSALTSFGIITQQVPVVTAPTLVLIDSSRQATEIIGFADTLEITQRVDDALAAK